MKRILLFVVTNLAVMLVLGLAASLLGVNRFLTANGLNLGALLGFAALMGFGGAIISLLISKPMAKWTTGAKIINDSTDPTHRWIVGAVQNFSQKAGIGMPEVAIYDGEPNAFATGAFKNSALVAVSTGLLQSMSRDEVEAVIGHEVAHVANGDMVTMTLIQGVMATSSTRSCCATTTTAPASATTSPPSCWTSCWACWPPSSWPGSRVSASTAPTRVPRS